MYILKVYDECGWREMVMRMNPAKFVRSWEVSAFKDRQFYGVWEHGLRTRR